ncbi:hypothetical protein ACH4FX_39075 [Streptomyces sp. NPDC018019]|uniref:hypothetical protein n=1 Tax=Streptomyces sp. NPDC018019 TaxID=3365030 RepID=UPI00379CFBC8
MSKTTRHRWDPLVAVSLAAGVGFTAYAEYQLARAIGAAVPVAVLLPLAIDVYVVAAIRRSRGRDIALSLVLMGTAQIAAHMLEARVATVSVPLVAAVSLLVPLVIWRVHTLAGPATTAVPVPAREAVPVPGDGKSEAAVRVTVEQQPVPVPETSPVPPAGTADTPRELPVLNEAVPRPELQAVPEPEPQHETAVPVRRARRTTRSSTARKKVTGSFDEHVSTARQWLADNPEMTGTDIGNRLGTGDSYGRRVRRAALAS